MSLSKSKKVIAALFAGSFIAVSAVAGVSAGAAGSESGIFGDINNDGTVNAKDLTRLMKYISGEKVEAYGVDLNGDGKENAKDLTRLMKYIADPDSVKIPETTGKPDSDTVTDPATDTETDPATDTETDPATDTETEPATDTETDPATDTETDPATDTETDPATDTETDPVTDPAEPETAEPYDLSDIELSTTFPTGFSSLEKTESADPYALVSEALNKNEALSEFSLGKQIILGQDNGFYYLKDTAVAGMSSDESGSAAKFRTDGLISVGDGTGNENTDYRYAAYYENGILYAQDDRNTYYEKEGFPYYMESVLAEYTLGEYQSEYELMLAEQTAFNKKAEVYTDSDGRTVVTAVFNVGELEQAGIDILGYIEKAAENDDRLLTDTIVMGNIRLSYIIDSEGYLSDVRIIAEDFGITYRIDASNSRKLMLTYDNILHFGRTDVKIPELPGQRDYFEYDPGYDILDMLFLPDGTTKVENYDKMYEWACYLYGKETVDDIIG